jgi:hypothetical protein
MTDKNQKSEPVAETPQEIELKSEGKEPIPKSRLELMEEKAQKEAQEKYEERNSLEDHRDLLKNRAYTP